MKPLLSAAIALAVFSLATSPASAQTGRLVSTNLGPAPAHVFTGNVLTPPPALGEKGASTRILYAPSEADDPALRAGLSLLAGGATVDYFDAINGSPGPALLATYDAVFTWVNFAMFDNVGFGNDLAGFADNGGTVILGAFCTYTSGNFLSGAIMGPNYSPVVSPTGTNHFSISTYANDGVSCLYAGVSGLGANYRDLLVAQGGGTVDGTFVDGEIANAYRQITTPGSGAVVYSNGAAGSVLGGTGDWGMIVANAVLCLPGSTSGTCTPRPGSLGLNPLGFDCVSVPVSGVTWHTTISTTPTVGTNTLMTLVAVGMGGGVQGVPLLGFEMLALPPYVLDTALGSHSIPIPVGTSGVGLSTQGVRVELDVVGNAIIVLMNAQDIVIG